MGYDVNALVERIVRLIENHGDHDRVLIGLGGVPAAGKSTLAEAVRSKCMELRIKLAVVGLDGYHLTRAQLDALDDPAEAHRRRGAYWTFDGDAAVAMVRLLRSSPNVDVATFDHAVKDPVPGGLVVTKADRVVLIEGLYVLLSQPPWSEIAQLVDETWFIDCSPRAARSRLARRHLAAGIVSTLEDGVDRADFNDLPNGDFIRRHLIMPDVYIDGNE